MRVTQQVKQATRQRILDAAEELFGSKGFDKATTRDIASAAGIATGTLFNYFPTKESIVLTFVDDELTATQTDFAARDNNAATLDEDLFAFIAAGLRRLRSCRSYIHPLVDACLNPLADDETARRVRSSQLETVVRIMTRHGFDAPPSAVGLHLFWTLYTGILVFWSADASPHQEDTLGLIDQSAKMFVNWMSRSADGPPGS